LEDTIRENVDLKVKIDRLNNWLKDEQRKITGLEHFKDKYIEMTNKYPYLTGNPYPTMVKYKKEI
jgi:hypothetical protein